MVIFESDRLYSCPFCSARVLDFQAVDNYVSNAVDITEVPRMPWHDISTTITGPVVIDLAQHFIERWNFVKHLKYRHDDRYEWLALPHPFQTPISSANGSVETVNQAAASREDGMDAARREERRREHPHLQDWLDRGR